MGFMAARTMRGCPFVMPPSRPPMRLPLRAYRPCSSVGFLPAGLMVSMTRLPRMVEFSKAGPISMPLTAGIERTA